MGKDEKVMGWYQWYHQVHGNDRDIIDRLCWNMLRSRRTGKVSIVCWKLRKETCGDHVYCIGLDKICCFAQLFARSKNSADIMLITFHQLVFFTFLNWFIHNALPILVLSKSFSAPHQVSRLEQQHLDPMAQGPLSFLIGTYRDLSEQPWKNYSGAGFPIFSR